MFLMLVRRPLYFLKQKSRFLKSVRLQAWMEDVHNLMRKVTLDDRDHGLLLGSDPSLLAVRRKIAARWASLRPPAFTGTPEESQNGTCQFKKQLVQLVDMYGTESPFAPEPPVLQILEHSEQPHQPPVPDVEAAEDRACANHAFSFLQSRKGVWTVLQAGISSLQCSLPCVLESVGATFTGRRIGQLGWIQEFRGHCRVLAAEDAIHAVVHKKLCRGLSSPLPSHGRRSWTCPPLGILTARKVEYTTAY